MINWQFDLFVIVLILAIAAFMIEPFIDEPIELTWTCTEISTSHHLIKSSPDEPARLYGRYETIYDYEEIDL